MTPSEMSPGMQLALEASFGSVAAWRAQFDAIGRMAAVGAGQAQLVFDPSRGGLSNHPLAQATDAVPGGTTLLTHHPHQPAPIDWADVQARYQAAVRAASAPWAADQHGTSGSLLLDVRRAGVFEQASTRLPGATWRDPAQVAQWAVELPRDTPVTVYCVHGHEVSQATALHLRAAGLDARYLRGGIDGWTAAGRPVVAKGDRS